MKYIKNRSIGKLIKNLAKKYAIRPISLWHPNFSRSLADYILQLTFEERVLEYTVVLQYMKDNSGPVLDVGSGESLLPIYLASLGYETHALDLYPYPYSYPNLHTHIGNICKTDFDDAYFSYILAVSSIEHAGLVNERDNDADRKAMREIRRIARPGALILLTLPFTKEYSIGKDERNYDKAFLEQRILPGFKTKGVQVFTRTADGYWLISQKAKKLHDIDIKLLPKEHKAVVFLCLELQEDDIEHQK